MVRHPEMLELSFITHGVDVIALNTYASKSGVTLDESGISWKTDREALYAQPSGFVAQLNPNNQACDTLLGKSGAKAYTDSSGYKYCFWYPNDDSTEYLYEMFSQISPIKGVTDEHFIVWMRTASTPTFRKVYGTINGDFNKGDVLTFNITANFQVNNIDATKALILTALDEFGTKNDGLGIVYLVTGSACMFFALLFATKHLLCPRKLGTELLDKWAAAESEKNRLMS